MSEKEYIERGAVEKAVSEPSMFDINKDDVLAMIADIPAADVVEVMHGRWIFEHDPINDPKKYFIRIVCSCCGLKTGQVSNFCPMCGAKMDGERKEKP